MPVATEYQPSGRHREIIAATFNSNIICGITQTQ